MQALVDIWHAVCLKQCKVGGKLVLITNRKSYMSFRLVPKSVTLNGKMPLFCVILPNLVVFWAHCVKVVDKAITVDIYDYCSSKHLQRDRSTSTV